MDGGEYRGKRVDCRPYPTRGLYSPPRDPALDAVFFQRLHDILAKNKPDPEQEVPNPFELSKK